jgi:four helix bundle protein
MKESIVKDKSFEFALMVIELYKIMREHNEFVISKQILRSGTSIGANVNEALAGISKSDFINKMSISSKEARETLYWLNLLNKSQLIKLVYSPYIQKCEELVKILTSIIKTTQSQNNNYTSKSKQSKTKNS